MSGQVNGRVASSTTTALLTEAGDWEVTVIMEEKRRIAGEDWESKTLSAVCTHKLFDKAYQVATNSVLAQYQDKIAENGVQSLFEKETE